MPTTIPSLSNHPQSYWKFTFQTQLFLLEFKKYSSCLSCSFKEYIWQKSIYLCKRETYISSDVTLIQIIGCRNSRHAIVEELGELGAKVYTCTRNEAKLNECLQEWSAKGLQVKGCVCDVSSREQRVQLMEKVSSAFEGKLNILINNVATNIWKPTVEYTAEEYAHMMATNLESSFHMCQLAYPLLKSSGAGTIVFISSVAGLVHLSGTSIYGATKGAINQLTRNLACEWAKDGVRVNGVAPWYINTPLVQHLLEDKAFMEGVISRTPLGRPGEVEEVSSMVAYLCLPAASYVTGQVIAVDGGFTIYGFQQPGY